MLASAGSESVTAENILEELAPKNDTVRLTPLAASAPVTLNLPAAPDSLFADSHSYSKEKLLESLKTLSPLQRRALTADYTTVIPQPDVKPTKSNEKGFTIRRYVTSIRPDKYFSGKIVLRTPDMASLFVDGKEVSSKLLADTVPGECKSVITIEPHRDVFIEAHVLSEGEQSVPEILLLPDLGSENATIAQGPDLKGRFNIYTLAGGERISSCDLSPNGNYLLTTQTYNEDGINTDSETAVTDLSGKKIILANVNGSASWMKNRPATLWWTDNTEKSGGEIILLDVPSGKQSVLASGIPEDAVGGLYFLPDESGFIYYKSVKGDKDTGIMRRVKSLDDRQPSNRNRYYLSLYRFKDKVEQPLTFGGPTNYLLSISPDSKKILYSSVIETPAKFPFYQQRLMEMDLNTLASDSVPGIDSSMTEAIYGPDGKQILVAAGPNAFGGIGLNAGNFTYGNDYDLQLYLVNPERNKDGRIAGPGIVTPLTRDFDPSVMAGVVWNKTDGNIYFRGETGFDALLYMLDPKSKKIKQLNDVPDYTRRWSISENHPEWITAIGMSYDYMGRAYLLNTRSGKSTLIADPNLPYLNGMELGKSESWSFECPADAYSKPDSIASMPTTVDCTVTFPPDFDPAKKYPMIVYYYGGTSPSSHTNHSPYTPNNFASRGYVVLTLNPSGTTGYGQEFSARHVNAWGDRTADEIIYGVKKFTAEHPYIEADKIGCLGASYGGFMTQLLQTKTDIFAAAVSHAGISNITSYWGEGWWGYSYNSVAAAGSYPWNNPSLFTDNSPLFAADKIHTPLLLLHGTVDTNVPIGESIQLYNALKLLGREVEFVTVEGSDHIVIDFEKRKEWHATIMAWFERWLKDDSRWWNKIYGE